MPTSKVERRHHQQQPVLFIRRRAARAELSEVLGQCLGAVFAYGGKAGAAFAGPPFSRYPSVDGEQITIEAGMPLAAPAAGEGEIEAGFLHGGAVAFAVHSGPYDQLGETYRALEQWMADNGERPGGAPWESYLTDPGEHPNPAEWRTEVYWPLAEN